MEKNIEKAIVLVDGLIVAHIKNSKGIRDLVKDWTSDTKGLAESIASVHDDVVICLIIIKKLLEKKPRRKNTRKSKVKKSKIN